jgi:predicted kinase
MAIAVRDSLANNKLVVAVGSFRSDEQRRQFRDIARAVGTNVTTIRIVCSVDTAAERVRSRLANGERGPTENAIRQIEAELNRATGIDITVRNDSSLDEFYQKIDAVMQAYAPPFCDQNTSGWPNLRSLSNLGGLRSE